MCSSDCDCDLLVCDIAVVVLKFATEFFLDKEFNKNFNFLFRCYIGFTFDGIEYGILTATTDDIDYGQFESIFTMMVIFIGIITIFCCCSHGVYLFLAALVFKSISLSIALNIFTTTTHFNWDAVEDLFEEIETAGDFFLAIVTFISFVDICLIIGTVALKALVIFIFIFSKKDCSEFSEVICKDDDKLCTMRLFSNEVGSYD